MINLKYFLALLLVFSVTLGYAQIPTNGLVAHYTFGGNADNQLGTGMNGALTSMTFQSDRFGNSNEAALFDGTAGYAQLMNSASNLSFIHNTHNFSISFHVRIDNLTKRHTIISCSATTTMKGFTLTFENHTSIGYQLLRFVSYRGVSGQNNQLKTDNYIINDNNWHHVVLLGNGASVRIYLDGVLLSNELNNPVNSSGHSNPDIYLGAAPTDESSNLAMTTLLEGALDDLRIYDRELTLAEVTSLFNEGNSGGGGSGGSLANLEDDGVNVQNSTVGTGHFQWDSLRFDGNTISSIDTDGDIILSPNGIGNVVLGSPIVPTSGNIQFGAHIVPFADNAYDIGNLTNLMRNGYFRQINIDSINVDGNTISSTNTNGNIILSPDGIGNVVLGAPIVPTSGNIQFGAHFVPYADNAYDIGNLTNLMRNGYFRQINIDNINVDGNTISSTNVNGDIILTANSGKIGVGTLSPDEALTVKGKIHTEEVKVDLSVPGPDYVFEEDYDLKSLEEIEAFIKSNNHLPEVPSAKEMEENGIELGVMNMLLLKKIEELTLYIIEQEKRIQALEKD